MTEPAMTQPGTNQAPTSTRSKPSRKAVVVVVAIDLVVATGVGFGVYFAARRFGPPTPPRNVEASATVCVPEECREITPSVSLSWTSPLAGGEVTAYVVLRQGEVVERLGPATTEFTDPDVDIGERYGYEVFAIGDEGRGRPSPLVSVRTPIPPIEHAHLGGFYGVRLVFRQIDLLSRFEGVPDPAVGDRTFQEWEILPVCTAFRGACNVTLFGWELVRHGREYTGSLPSNATCGNERVESKRTVTLRVTKARVVGHVLTVSAFTGVSEVDLRCGGEKVHAVAGISGTLAQRG
jgi:hypothetical protein